MVSRFLFRLAKTAFFGKAVGVGLAYFSFLIPVKKVHETAATLVFYHPKPAWANHVVIVPKKPIGTLLNLSQPDNIRYISAIFFSARDVIAKLSFTDKGYVLCANGGPRQEVGQVHFHLFTGKRLVGNFLGGVDRKLVLRGATLEVFHHPDPEWETHIVIEPMREIPPLYSIGKTEQPVLEEVLGILPALDEKLQLVKRGYTLVIQEMNETERRQFLCHIVSGKRLKSVS